MSSVLPAPATPEFSPSEALRGPFAGFRRRHILLILCFSVITPLTFTLFGLAFGEHMYWLAVLGEVAKYIVISFTTVGFALATDQHLRRRIGSGGSLAVALVAATLVSTVLIQLIAQLVITPLGWDSAAKMESKGLTSSMRVLLELIGAARWSLVLVALYELLESNHRASEELHAARMTAVAAQQNLVEGELRAMQARVDPELLFNSLVAIDEGYAQDLETGQHRLDSLIRFLRAALPSDFGGTSTVAREQEVVEAYVALLGQRDGEAARLHMRVDPGAGGEQMPSMLLLPLVRWALAAQAVRNLSVRIGRRDAKLAIRVESDAPRNAAAPIDEITSVRERIRQLYPDGAQLAIESSTANLEIPRQAPALPA